VRPVEEKYNLTAVSTIALLKKFWKKGAFCLSRSEEKNDGSRKEANNRERLDNSGKRRGGTYRSEKKPN